MYDNAIYFPYINVPNDEWFSRVLLYWDSVNSIVPFDYLHHPERLSPYMAQLVETGLVEQVVPGTYLYGTDNLAVPFLTYVERSIGRRRNKPSGGLYRPVRIHAEKIEGIAAELEQMGVTRFAHGSWYDMEKWVATAFMAFVATVLGNQEQIRAAPVTHDMDSFRLLGGGQRVSAYRRRKFAAREALLPKLFPVPGRSVAPAGIARFKERYGAELRRCRRFLDARCVDLAQISSSEARDDAVALLAAELAEQVEELQRAMRETWPHMVLTRIIPLLGSGIALAATNPEETLARIGNGVSLTGAIYQALAGTSARERALAHPLAYAALAESAFLPNGRPT